MNPRINYSLALILLISILGAGCTGKSPKATYYILSSMENDSSPLQPAASQDDLSIGVDRIKFPDELDRPSIVTRSGQNQLEVNEFHRWGGSLAKNVTQVILENIALLMKTDQVMARPWERYFKPDFRVLLDIRQFDGRLGEYVLLKTTWSVFEKEKDLPALVRRSVIKEAVADDSYGALVAAQSVAIYRLCQEIAGFLSEPPLRNNNT